MKKIIKNRKKSVDKGKKEWYDSKAVREKRVAKRTLKIKQCERKNEHTTRNFLKKRFEKNPVNEELTKRDAKRRKKSQRAFLNEMFSADALDIQMFREFDPGSGRTLAACLTHASRTEIHADSKIACYWTILCILVADGRVTREEPAFQRGITNGNVR